MTVAAYRVWCPIMRSHGMTATIKAQVEFATLEAANRCREQKRLPDGIDFGFHPGVPPGDAVNEGRVVEIELQVNPVFSA